jgi:hypothetical protein
VRRNAIFFISSKIVMAALVAAIHFPETGRYLHRFWKMDGRDLPGHDDSEAANLRN